MKRNDRNTKKEHMFLKIWLRTGLPILLISAAALFLVAGLLLSAVEMLGGQRIGQIGTELALILSKQDLTDRAAAVTPGNTCGWENCRIVSLAA